MRSIRRAVVLAAGRGKRMGDLTENLPKPLLPVAGKALILRLLDHLAEAGLAQVEIVTGYLGQRLETVVRGEQERADEVRGAGSRSLADLEIGFHPQDELTGTATALLACRSACSNEPFLLSWGDVLASAHDYRRVTDAFGSPHWRHVLGVNRVEDPTAGAAVYVSANGTIESIVEKPAAGSSTTCWNNAGVFALGPEIFDYAAAVEPSARGEYELTDAIEQMLAHGIEIGACEIAGWRHIGTPAELEQAHRDLP